MRSFSSISWLCQAKKEPVRSKRLNIIFAKRALSELKKIHPEKFNVLMKTFL